MNNDNFLEFMKKITIKYCGYNPGAINFFLDCMNIDDENCIKAFERMFIYGIREDKLYMIWNDCCNRNTKKALDIMLNNDIDDIRYHINYEHGRGIPYTD